MLLLCSVDTEQGIVLKTIGTVGQGRFPMRDYSKQSNIRATERDVEITGLETCVIEGNFDWNIVEIHTDVCTDSLTTAAWAS